MLRASSGRLVGRDGELTRLLGLLDDASDGRPSHALISGDAGVGKTRLVAELATRAADRGFLVLSGRCAELGDSIPYLPLADALREGTTTPGAATEPLAAALAARPVLGRLLPDRDAVAQPGGEVSGLAQQQLFGAVLGLLAELAEGHPVLLILEDLHWADRSTRDLVTFLSRVLHRERVAVVATYRTDDLHRRHPLRPVVAELLRLPSVASIELGPLGYADMADHLTALAGGPLDPAALHRMVARAEGNPYYAEELLAAAAPGPAAARAGGGGLARGGGRLGHRRRAAQRAGRAAAGPGGAAARRGPAGAAGRRGRRAPGRRRHRPGRVRAGRAGVRGRDPGLRGPAAAGAGRRGRLRVPARPDPRGALHRPAARRADQAARPVRRAAGRPGPAAPPCRGPPPSWPTTAWPATTSRARSPRRSGPGRSPSGWPPRPRRTGTTTPRSRCGSGSASRRSWPGRTGTTWPSAPRTAPRPAARSPGPCSSCAASAASSARTPTRCWPAGCTSASPTTCSNSTRRPTRRRPRGPRCSCSRPTRRARSGPGPWPPTRRR